MAISPLEILEGGEPCTADFSPIRSLDFIGEQLTWQANRISDQRSQYLRERRTASCVAEQCYGILGSELKENPSG